MKANIKFLMVSVMLLGVAILGAQDYQKDPYTLEGQGQALTFRLVLGEKTVKLFLVGKETAKFNFDKDAKLLEVTAFKDDAVREELKFEPGKGYYTIKELPKWDSPYTLNVKARVKGSEESVQLKMKAKP